MSKSSSNKSSSKNEKSKSLKTKDNDTNKTSTGANIAQTAKNAVGSIMSGSSSDEVDPLDPTGSQPRTFGQIVEAIEEDKKADRKKAKALISKGLAASAGFGKDKIQAAVNFVNGDDAAADDSDENKKSLGEKSESSGSDLGEDDDLGLVDDNSDVSYDEPKQNEASAEDETSAEDKERASTTKSLMDLVDNMKEDVEPSNIFETIGEYF